MGFEFDGPGDGWQCIERHELDAWADAQRIGIVARANEMAEEVIAWAICESGRPVAPGVQEALAAKLAKMSFDLFAADLASFKVRLDGGGAIH